MSIQHFVTSDRQRFRHVHPTWILDSEAMVWDVDTCQEKKLIVAASSDCSIYLVDFEGNLVDRCELPTGVQHVNFIANDQVIANGRAGELYGYRLLNSGGDFYLHKNWVCELAPYRGGSEGVPTSFSSLGSDRILAGYGDTETNTGGIVLMDITGQKLWNRNLNKAILGVEALQLKNSSNLIGIAYGREQDETFSVFFIENDGNTLQPLVEGVALAAIVGISNDSQHILLGVTYDLISSELLCIDVCNGTQISIPTVGFPANAEYLDKHDWIAATCTPINDDSRNSCCNVSVWQTSGETIWIRDMIKQTFQIAFDAYNELLFVSSFGQGNVYSIDLSGRIIACAKVRHAPLCFVTDPKTDTLLIGSGDLNRFNLSDFK